MRAARERADLTQEQVAERMNVSIHTFRRWDQDRNRPSRPEQMQLLAAVLDTRIETIWPATDDPLVAEALRHERQRAASPPREPAQRSTRTALPDAAETIEILGRQAETPSAASLEETASEPSADTGPRAVPSVEDPEPTSDLNDLPPWPDDDLDHEPPPEQTSVDRVVENPDVTNRGPVLDRSAEGTGDAVTLRAARPPTGGHLKLKRMAVALGVALAVGGVGMVAASALGERSDDGGPSTQPAAERIEERKRADARAGDVAAMRATAERGDYDAAIVLARQLGDSAAASGYREAAARLLVSRAEKAARRGDLPLARSRLSAAKRRYGTAPGSNAVAARIRAVERQRTKRAQQQRAAARRAAAAQAAQPPVESSARSSDSSASGTATPSQSATPQSSGTASSGSSSTKRSGGGSSKSEKTVDPGCTEMGSVIVR